MEHRRTALPVAQQRLYTGIRRLQAIEWEAQVAVDEYLAGRGTKQPSIDVAELEGRLFTLSEVPPPVTSAPEDEKGSHAGSVGPPDEDERLHQEIFRKRHNAIDEYFQAQADFDSHRSSYSRRLYKYLNGGDPGLVDWSADWPRETFEAAFLLEGTRLSAALTRAQNAMDRLIRFAVDAGLEPLPDQTRDFYQPGTFAYPLSFENEMIAQAPRAVIFRWGGFLPSDPRDFAAADQASDSQQVVEEALELQPGDSSSCAAMDQRDRQRLETFGTGRPDTWGGTDHTRKPE